MEGEAGKLPASPAQRLLDEVARGVAEGVAIVSVLVGELSFQSRVPLAQLGIGGRHLQERDQRAGMRVIVLDHVQVMG